jgi:excisionase family DNA binding protein
MAIAGKRWQTEDTLGVARGDRPVESRFMLLSDVAAELNVSDSQVYHMVRSGELPAIKIGGRGQWRVERAKLEKYIEQRYAETADWVAQNPLSTPEPE